VASIINHRRGQGITVHEKISDSQLISLYDTSDFLVMPSLYEGLGLPILEGIGRCAVLANDIPVFRELGQYIEGISYLRFQEDPVSLELLSEQLLRLSHCPPARFKSEAIQLQFTWQTCASSIVGHLLAGRPENQR
jgi:glycosyltransferase involved in cell wall biosynthesis